MIVRVHWSETESAQDDSSIDVVDQNEESVDLDLSSLLAHIAVKLDVTVNGVIWKSQLTLDAPTNIVGTNIAKKIGIPVTKAPRVGPNWTCKQHHHHRPDKGTSNPHRRNMCPDSVLVQDEDPRKFLLGNAWMVKHKANPSLTQSSCFLKTTMKASTSTLSR